MSEDLDLLDELAELAQETVHDGVQMYAEGVNGWYAQLLEQADRTA